MRSSVLISNPHRLLWSKYYRRSPCVLCGKFSSQSILQKKKKDKFSETVLLPKTSFTGYLKGQDEANIRMVRLSIILIFVVFKVILLQSDKFEKLYERQRLDARRKEEFILHDGPPYANGKAHLGHAVNKVCAHHLSPEMVN